MSVRGAVVQVVSVMFVLLFSTKLGACRTWWASKTRTGAACYAPWGRRSTMSWWLSWGTFLTSPWISNYRVGPLILYMFHRCWLMDLQHDSWLSPPSVFAVLDDEDSNNITAGSIVTVTVTLTRKRMMVSIQRTRRLANVTVPWLTARVCCCSIVY